MSSYHPSRKLIVSKPCTESWDEMTGALRRRHCTACGRDVLNTTAMTPREIEAVIATGKPVCMRIVQHADGSIMTANEEKTSRFPAMLSVAASAFVAVSSIAAAQTSRQQPEKATATVSGTVLDENGKPVNLAEIHIALSKGNGFVLPIKTTTNAAGEFIVELPKGKYTAYASLLAQKNDPYTEDRSSILKVSVNPTKRPSRLRFVLHPASPTVITVGEVE